MLVPGTQNNISVLLSFNLREDWFLRMKNTHFRLGFTRFLVISGPWTHHYFSRQAREVILMGPRTGNDQKTGKTRRKWVFFILRNQSALKLKKVVHITVYFDPSLPSSLILLHLGRKQAEAFLNVVGIIFPIKHWNCADNQNNSGCLAESSFQWNTRIILQ